MTGQIRFLACVFRNSDILLHEYHPNAVDPGGFVLQIRLARVCIAADQTCY
jgi:hypothetical protein